MLDTLVPGIGCKFPKDFPYSFMCFCPHLILPLLYYTYSLSLTLVLPIIEFKYEGQGVPLENFSMIPRGPYKDIFMPLKFV